MCTENEWSNDYEEYVSQRRYTLLTVSEYGKLLENVGFKDVDAKDATKKFVDCLKMELTRIESTKDDFIQVDCLISFYLIANFLLHFQRNFPVMIINI